MKNDSINSANSITVLMIVVHNILTNIIVLAFEEAFYHHFEMVIVFNNSNRVW